MTSRTASGQRSSRRQNREILGTHRHRRQDQSPDQPPASGDPGEDAGQSPAPPASPVDRSLVLMVAAIMYTKPGPGSVRDAYQHAKNLIEMLDEDEAADKNAP